MLPILVAQARQVTAARARSGRPDAPVRAAADQRGSLAPRRSPGPSRRAVAAALRRSADRLDPAIE